MTYGLNKDFQAKVAGSSPSSKKTRKGDFESRSFEEYFLLEQKELFDEYN